jgi:anti-anti-sigma factor
MSSQPPFRVIPGPESTTVVLSGAVNGPLSRSLHVLLKRSARETSDLVVDLQRTTSLDALGLRALLDVAATCTAAGGSLRIVGPQPHIRAYLEVTELDQRVTVLESSQADSRLEAAPRRARGAAVVRRGQLLDRQVRVWWNSISPWTS